YVQLHDPSATIPPLTYSNLPAFMQSQGGHNSVTSACPSDGRLALAAGVSILFTGDGGTTWQPVTPGGTTMQYQSHNDYHGVAWNGRTAYVANDGGIVKVTFVPPGSAWTWSIANDINTLPVANEKWVDVGDDCMFAAAWDVGTHWSCSGQPWTGDN